VRFNSFLDIEYVTGRVRSEGRKGGDSAMINIEKIAERVHDAWWEEKKRQGFHSPEDCSSGGGVRFGIPCERCHSDMYPYDELSENVKEYDRKTVWAVLNAMGIEEEEEKRQRIAD